MLALRCLMFFNVELTILVLRKCVEVMDER
jgi:hypothetical protein